MRKRGGVNKKKLSLHSSGVCFLSSPMALKLLIQLCMHLISNLPLFFSSLGWEATLQTHTFWEDLKPSSWKYTCGYNGVFKMYPLSNVNKVFSAFLQLHFKYIQKERTRVTAHLFGYGWNVSLSVPYIGKWNNTFPSDRETHLKDLHLAFLQLQHPPITHSPW